MKLPQLFREIHADEIFRVWVSTDQPPFIQVFPNEPLGAVTLDFPGDAMPDTEVTIVRVRCWNDRGVMQFEAASAADLKAAEEWAERHKDTPAADFKWLPGR